MKARSRNICSRGKEVSITYYECVFVAIFIQYAKRMRRMVICGVSESTVVCQIVSQTAKFLGKLLLNMKYVFWISLQILSENFLILSRIHIDIVINVHRF